MLLVSSDLSAVFDVVEHATLLKRLFCSLGVSGIAYSWIKSYLGGRTQSVRKGSYSSAVTSCSVSVPQGSVLGPLLFSAYKSPLSTVAKFHQVFQQQYADDTQLYVALSPINYFNELITLQSCLSSLHVWFCENGMALNPSKSDAILFGTAQRLETMFSLTFVKIADSAMQFSDTIKILGVTLDSNLTLGPHIKAISKSCFYHIRSFRQIRLSRDRSMAIAVASALVSAKHDYANSIFFGCLQKHIFRLQRVQHALARVVMQQVYCSSSSTEVLKQLHWLPIKWRIKFKLATSTYKTCLLYTSPSPRD